MCGRFVSSSTPDEIAKYFGVADIAEKALEPNYNVAPTTDVYTVFEDGGVRRLDAFHWGLVPRWAKDVKIGNRMINARAETLAEKNAFKSALARRRCIIPADGFYEWAVVEGRKKKQPLFIHRADGDPLAFAGLWETWKGPERDADEVLLSCTIVTCAANETMAPVHDRMPVVLPPDAWDRWLDRDLHDVELLGRLLVPAPPRLLTMHPVSFEVNNVRNRGAHLVDEVDPADLDP